MPTVDTSAPRYPAPAGPPPAHGVASPSYDGQGYARNGHGDDAFDATPFGDRAAASPGASSPYYNERQQMPNMYYGQQPESRPPPPRGPPPAYARILNRTFYSLRPVLLVTCIISIIYLIFLAYANLRVGAQGQVSQRLRTSEIVQGVLFLVAMCVEFLGLMAAYRQQLKLARLYSFMSLGGFAALLAAQIMGVVSRYSLKNDIIMSCTTYYSTGNTDGDDWLYGGSSDETAMSVADARRYCESIESRRRTWEIVWLVIAAIVGAFFVLLSFAYARQLADPNSVRERAPRQQTQWAAPPYDPEGAYRYPPGPNNPYAYPPPPAPMYGGPSPPMYEGRSSTEGYSLDNKDPTGAFAAHARADASNPFDDRRPGSSRGVRRASDDTLHDDTSKPGARRDRDEDDGTPRI